MRVKIYRKIIRPIVNNRTCGWSWHDDTDEMREYLIRQIKEVFGDSVKYTFEEKYIECGEIERG